MMVETAKEMALVGLRGAIAGMIAVTAVVACGADSTPVPDGPVSARLRAAVEWLAAPEREGRGRWCLGARRRSTRSRGSVATRTGRSSRKTSLQAARRP